jgi:hypothetical protein
LSTGDERDPEDGIGGDQAARPVRSQDRSLGGLFEDVLDLLLAVQQPAVLPEDELPPAVLLRQARDL